ncbi:hypothetical protein E2C01_030135 [Portunus trituberculatus]|uniref:Uncharacterized protein n=1 Tax=Portunus trituberculatus TaxID=210409 RepID=A0A5B7ETV8_PORTR|nr:hypothetical protein [Portunus trituberculatus]
MTTLSTRRPSTPYTSPPFRLTTNTSSTSLPHSFSTGHTTGACSLRQLPLLTTVSDTTTSCSPFMPDRLIQKQCNTHNSENAQLQNTVFVLNFKYVISIIRIFPSEKKKKKISVLELFV